jgi:molecular chaperone GrpE
VKKEKKQDKDEQKKEDKTAQVKAVDEKDKKIAELTDTLQRLQAEFENFQKRCEKGNSEFRSYAAAEVIEKFLPILDSFELALKHSANHAEFVKGVELIYGQLYDMIEKQGVRPIRAVGCKFDCYRHEVLLTEKTDKEEEDEKIVEELQKGYMFKDKVLRFSKVKVLKKCQ